MGGEEEKNSNPFVFVIRTVLRDAWVKEEEEEGEAVSSSSCHMKPEVYPLSQ